MTEVSWPAEKPHLVLRPSSGWQAINLLQIWQYRDLLMTLAMRDVKLRYRQTALGAIWVIIQPLLGAGILSFVFNRVANVPTGSIPPFVFAFAGMLGFTAFSSTLSKASSSLVGNSQLVSKVFFPRLVLPLSTILSTLVDFSVSLIMLFILMLIYRITPTPQLLLLPLWLALILFLSLGCGLIAGALTVSYRDVQYVLPVVVNLLTFASPIAYAASFAASKLPAGVQPFYFILNPLASLLEAFRWSLLGTGEVRWSYVIYSTVFAVVLFLIGAFSFKKMERKFADVI
jgi:lipopolysaccharide transport system permease protein